MKYLLLASLFLLGCNVNHSVYERVENKCPGMCLRNEKAMWTGTIKVKPEVISCICESPK